ncbi:MAG: hypothetical protein ACI8S6_005870 [Myxococcota bacterium]
MTPAQQARARAIMSETVCHPGLPEIADSTIMLEVWSYPPEGLWVRWLLYDVDARYWVRRTICQPAGSDDTVYTSVAEVHIPTPTISPLLAGGSGMTLPFIPLEDDQLPQPTLVEEGLICSGLELRWAAGRLEGPWGHMATLHARFVACFETALPPAAR